MKKAIVVTLVAVKELAWFSAFVLAVKYVPWEPLVFVVVVGVIIWFFQSAGEQ